MSNKLIVFSHNDLDAVGSMLCIHQKFPDIEKVYFHTNYSNIPAKVDDILAYANFHEIKGVLITDVSFSDNKESLEKLYNRLNVTLIDHHMYPDGFWDAFPNMKVIHDKSKSAALLTYEYLGCQHETLKKLITIIDIYDLWQDKHKAFDFAQNLNEYFWELSLDTFYKRVIENDYNLPTDYVEVVGAINAKINGVLEQYETRKLIHRFGPLTVGFVDEYFNQFMMKEMKQGQKIVAGIYDWGLVRVRLAQDYDFDVEAVNNIREELTSKRDHGHFHAFTYLFKHKPNSLEIIKEVERIVESVKKNLSK